MKKIIIASHQYLAQGLKSTLEYIVPNTVEVIDINAYIENISVENQILTSLEQCNEEEQIFVFTDLLGGSVNQGFIEKITKYNIELIAGANLPIIMTIVLSLGEQDLTKDEIRVAIEEARNQLVYVNDLLSTQEIDEDDE